MKVRTIAMGFYEMETVFQVARNTTYLISAILLRPREWWVHIPDQLPALALCTPVSPSIKELKMVLLSECCCGH